MRVLFLLIFIIFLHSNSHAGYFTAEHEQTLIDQAHRQNVFGKDVKIAILDTGVDPNEQWHVTCVDIIAESSTCDDQSGHGTHLAGIIHAQGQHKKINLIGIAPKAEVFALRVVPNGHSGVMSNLAKGIN